MKLDPLTIAKQLETWIAEAKIEKSPNLTLALECALEMFTEFSDQVGYCKKCQVLEASHYLDEDGRCEKCNGVERDHRIDKMYERLYSQKPAPKPITFLNSSMFDFKKG